MDGSLEDRMKIAESLIAALYESHEKTESELRMLTRSQVLMSEAGRKTDERLAEATDKLNGLIDLMDRHLREHQKGDG